MPSQRRQGQWQEEPPEAGWHWIVDDMLGIVAVRLAYEHGEWVVKHSCGETWPLRVFRPLWWSEPIQAPPAPQEGGRELRRGGTE